MQAFLTAIRNTELSRRTGTVTQYFGLVVESTGPDVFLGEMCEIFSKVSKNPIAAEVVGLKDGKVLLMPFEELRGISIGSVVIATGQPVSVEISDDMLGRVIDAFGRPIDDKLLPKTKQHYPIYSDTINPLRRKRIQDILETGVKAIDTLLTLGKGQRIGIFSGSGVGKSTLLGMIARNMNADINVIALVGERGREVRDFIEDILGDEGLKRSVVVVATSDQPALTRSHAAYTATAIAEYFRSQGKDVVLTMDSVTRFAMAQREVGLAIGEPPTARGYTPSVFAALPRLLERGGSSESGGTITALYTVLVEGDDLNDPISDAIRAILDGHIVLSREMANQGHYPAIDVLQSISRLMPDLVEEEHIELAKHVNGILGAYQSSKDMIEVGAYRSGSNPKIDRAIKQKPLLDDFLQQTLDYEISREQALSELKGILRENIIG